MRAIDKLTQIVRRSVNMIWRKKIDPVVAPSEISRKVGDRHHFDHGDANLRQLRQLFGGGLPGSFLGESADVHFVNDMAFHFHSAPLRIGPSKFGVIDNARGTMRAMRLKSRCGIGMKMLGLVY